MEESFHELLKTWVLTWNCRFLFLKSHFHCFSGLFWFHCICNKDWFNSIGFGDNFLSWMLKIVLTNFWKRITHFSFWKLSQNSTPRFSLNWNKSNHIRYTTKYFKIKQICRRIFEKTQFQDYFVSFHANYENNIIYPFWSPTPTFSLSLYFKISKQNLFCFQYTSIRFFEISKPNRYQNNNKIPHPNCVFSFSFRNFTFLLFIELFFTFSKCPNLWYKQQLWSVLWSVRRVQWISSKLYKMQWIEISL